METAYLIEQINSLRAALRFLRSENSFLKSQDLLSTLDALPSYDLPPTPPLTPEPSDLDDDDALPSPSRSLLPTPPIALPLQAFQTQSRLLLREARLLSATPRLVDVSTTFTSPSSSATGTAPKRAWQPAKRDPQNQLWAEKERARELKRKMERLMLSRPAGLEGGGRPWVGVVG